MARRPIRSTALPLFLALLASQSAISTLSPLLGEMARDLEASPELLGQLRSVSGLFAGGAALWLASGRSLGLELRALILLGLGLLAAGVLTTAAAPNLAVLILAQVPLGLGIAVTVSGATAAAGEWAEAGKGPSVLAWALTGQPAAWVVGLPLVGIVATVHWRLSWLTVPLGASVLAAAVIAGRPRGATSRPGIRLRELLAKEGVAAWAFGELLAYSAWTGMLVYSGALFTETHGTSVGVTSTLLAGVAAAYAAGNLALRRLVSGGRAPVLIGLGLAAAAGTVVVGAVRPSTAVTFLLFVVLAFLAAGRALAGAVVGLGLAPGLGGMSLRTAALQLGYLIGSVLGGAAIAVGGYGLLGIALGALLIPAIVPYIVVPRLRRPEPLVEEKPAAPVPALMICP